ncbi:hypothetical protein SNOG_14884 [Parastagonospora nodorum SN15]|uniref:Uncharacterized protein n=1 Tax=Phaeosphaeria nodorum (strain SN15 / ATCC MYA-4574 / FGSC 10173) TaxID=321614 RepID=Q0U038_PHANO|nr:hypothetical protein SNOG_14884 [Parastagonospora nodorum SN15]EAT77736.1 hypothetical protein SNOG_14884 [Parastagonospora nodorum SN15]
MTSLDIEAKTYKPSPSNDSVVREACDLHRTPYSCYTPQTL